MQPVRNSATGQPQPIFEEDYPLHIRLADKLGTLLVLTDQLIGVARTDEAQDDPRLAPVEPTLVRVYGEIEDLLAKLVH